MSNRHGNRVIIQRSTAKRSFGACLRAFAVLLGVAVYGGACASEPQNDPPGGCVPGRSSTCAGPSGCVGFQVCATDGRTFGPCQCGGTGGAPGDASFTDVAYSGGVAGTTPDASIHDSSVDAPIEDVQWLPFDAPGDVGKTVCGQCVIANCLQLMCDPNDVALCADCFDIVCKEPCATWLKAAALCAHQNCKAECCN